MNTAKYSNSVNATEIFFGRQTALDKARQEVNESKYDPSTQVPLCESEHNIWLAYWQPIWDADARREQVDAGRTHYACNLPLETCCTSRMRWGWRQAQRAHNYATWRTIAADAILEEKDQKPGLNVDDDHWMDWEPSNSDLAMEALADTYPRGI